MAAPGVKLPSFSIEKKPMLLSNEFGSILDLKLKIDWHNNFFN
jgi:hypothetical protein